MAVTVHILDPLSDSRWEELTARHSGASVFHQRAWLESSKKTFGYDPFVLTTSPGRPLRNGIVFYRVSSWLTGKRLVSLPFSDHCEPLLSDASEFGEFANWLCAECDRQRYRYVEIRPRSEFNTGDSNLQPAQSYWFHELDLEPALPVLFGRLHKNSFQRKIQRAERERLNYEIGRSARLLDELYGLLLMTRKRHGLLPHPRTWFKNLVECMGDKVEIRLARKKDGTAIAAMLTLRHRSRVVYKYGGSDKQFHALGGMPFLFWRLIEESKAAGVGKIDLGRSDLDQRGLVVFKDRLGTMRELRTYYRYTNAARKLKSRPWESQSFREAFCRLPDSLLSASSRLLYKHMG